MDSRSHIILVGGSSHTGKTLMAQKLLKKYGYPYLSIDHLKMGLYRADIGCGFTPLDDAEHVSEKLWPILKGIIMTAIENSQNLIIEGVYLLPQRVKELGYEYLRNVTLLYLGFSQSYIEMYFESGIIGNRCAIEDRKYENTCTSQDFILANMRQKEVCAEHGAKYFEINEDYLREIEDAYLWIDAQMA